MRRRPLFFNIVLIKCIAFSEVSFFRQKIILLIFHPYSLFSCIHMLWFYNANFWRIGSRFLIIVLSQRLPLKFISKSINIVFFWFGSCQTIAWTTSSWTLSMTNTTLSFFTLNIGRTSWICDKLLCKLRMQSFIQGLSLFGCFLKDIEYNGPLSLCELC